MTDYASVAAHTETFDVVIEPCVPSLAPVSIAAQSYTVNDAQLDI